MASLSFWVNFIAFGATGVLEHPARATRQAGRRVSAGAGYVNFLEPGPPADRVRAAHRGNFDRLAAIKAAHDPDNVFRLNQNIPPARQGDSHD